VQQNVGDRKWRDIYAAYRPEIVHDGACAAVTGQQQARPLERVATTMIGDDS